MWVSSCVCLEGGGEQKEKESKKKKQEETNKYPTHEGSESHHPLRNRYPKNDKKIDQQTNRQEKTVEKEKVLKLHIFRLLISSLVLMT